MDSCDKYNECTYINSDLAKDMGVFLDALKVKYCHGDYKKCARYILGKKIGYDKVPQTLLPAELEEAIEIANKLLG